MFGLGLVIFTAIFVVSLIKFEASVEEVWFGASMISGIGAFVCLISTIVLIVNISNGRVIDDQIAMYQEENDKIETQIATVVYDYQKHEEKIFTECTPESAVTLVTLYPELKSDTLVQAQIDIYLENNECIKELKEKDIKQTVYKWMLYFGK